MENPFGAEAVGHLEEMMRAEDEKEITQIATGQGQIVALIVLLRSKGVLDSEDVNKWETLSIESCEKVAALLKATRRAQQAEEEGDTVDSLEAKADLLRRSIDFGRLMSTPECKLESIQNVVDELEEEVEKLRGTDQDG